MKKLLSILTGTIFSSSIINTNLLTNIHNNFIKEENNKKLITNIGISDSIHNTWSENGQNDEMAWTEKYLDSSVNSWDSVSTSNVVNLTGLFILGTYQNYLTLYNVHLDKDTETSSSDFIVWHYSKNNRVDYSTDPIDFQESFIEIYLLALKTSDNDYTLWIDSYVYGRWVGEIGVHNELTTTSTIDTLDFQH